MRQVAASIPDASEAVGYGRNVAVICQDLTINGAWFNSGLPASSQLLDLQHLDFRRGGNARCWGWVQR